MHSAGRSLTWKQPTCNSGPGFCLWRTRKCTSRMYILFSKTVSREFLLLQLYIGGKKTTGLVRWYAHRKNSKISSKCTTSSCFFFFSKRSRYLQPDLLIIIISSPPPPPRSNAVLMLILTLRLPSLVGGDRPRPIQPLSFAQSIIINKWISSFFLVNQHITTCTVRGGDDSWESISMRDRCRHTRSISPFLNFTHRHQLASWQPTWNFATFAQWTFTAAAPRRRTTIILAAGDQWSQADTRKKVLNLCV